MSESVALLAQIEQAPNTANGEGDEIDQSLINGNGTHEHAF